MIFDDFNCRGSKGGLIPVSVLKPSGSVRTAGSVTCRPADVPSLYNELHNSSNSRAKINLGNVKLVPLYLILATILFDCGVISVA